MGRVELAVRSKRQIEDGESRDASLLLL